MNTDPSGTRGYRPKLEGYYLESLRRYGETGTGKPFQLPPERRTAHPPAQARNS